MPGSLRPPRAAGGVAAELGVVDPRKAQREKAPRDIREPRRRRGQGRARPGSDPSAHPPMPEVSELQGYDDTDPYEEALELQPRQGRRGKSSGKVRVYHRAGKHGNEQCWAFTITREAFERLRSDRVLDHRGATYPDGSVVVPRGRNPIDFPVHCGSCGTHSVECLQIIFREE